MRFQSVSGSLRVSTKNNGLALVVAKGVTSQAEVRAVLEAAWALRCRKRENYLALIIDVRRAWVQDYEGGQVMYPESPGIPTLMKSIPTAMLVPPYMMPNARRYSMLCAMDGAVVGAFTEVADGLRWVLERGKAIRGNRQARPRTKSPVTQWRTPSGAVVRRECDPASEPDPEPMG